MEIQFLNYGQHQSWRGIKKQGGSPNIYSGPYLGVARLVGTPKFPEINYISCASKMMKSYSPLNNINTSEFQLHPAGNF